MIGAVFVNLSIVFDSIDSCVGVYDFLNLVWLSQALFYPICRSLAYFKHGASY